MGVDKIRASVNIDYDQGSTEESQQKYDPSVSALLSEQKTQEQAGEDVPGAAGSQPEEFREPAATCLRTKPKTAAPQTPSHADFDVRQLTVWGEQGGDPYGGAGGHGFSE